MAVIESEVELREFAAREPAGFGRIVAAARCPSDGNRVVENADRMTSRIPFRIGVDPPDASDPNVHAGLLADFPGARLLRRFAHFAKTARKRPLPLERRPPPANEQNPSAAIPRPGVHGEPWTPGRPPTAHGRLPGLSKNSRISSAG